MPAMERSRALPNLRVTTRFLPTSASSTRQAAMYPSCWRISAMWDLILEYGMPTVSWYAEFAFRRRVSMSAIGSVIVMANRPSSPRFPPCDIWGGDPPDPPEGTCGVLVLMSLPAGLGDTGQFAAVRHGAEADPAQAEPLVDGPRPPAA